MSEAKAFLAVSLTNGSYGKANTIRDAVKRCRMEGGITKQSNLRIHAFSCEPEYIMITAGADLRYEVPQDTAVLKFDVVM